MNIIKKTDPIVPFITKEQAIMVNNINHYMQEMQDKGVELVQLAKEQARQITCEANAMAKKQLEEQSLIFHQEAYERVEKLLTRVANSIFDVIISVFHKQKINFGDKAALKELISKDLRCHLDADHVELFSNSECIAEIEGILKPFEYKVIFSVDENLSSHQCRIETIYSIIHIDFKASYEQLLNTFATMYKNT